MIAADDVGEKQMVLLRTIHAWIAEKQYAPSVLELCYLLNVRSTSGVLRRLDALRRRGLVKRDIATWRSIVITDAGMELLR